MPVTPVEIRHLQLRRGLFGYRRGAVHQVMDDIADSFEGVWRERADLMERVEALEAELSRHAELEELLRSTLVSAERAASDMKEHARREADVIVGEANAEARRILREAIAEKQTLLGEVRKIRSLLRSALDVVETQPEERPDARREPDASRPAPVAPAVEGEPTDPGIRRIAG